MSKTTKAVRGDTHKKELKETPYEYQSNILNQRRRSHELRRKVQEVMYQTTKKKGAILVIQKLWRGYRARRQVANIKFEKMRAKKEKQWEESIKQYASSIICKAVYEYVLRKREKKKFRIKRYINECAVKIQKVFKGFLIRRAFRKAFERKYRFQILLSSCIKGWKMRKIMRHKTITYLLQEIRELNKFQREIKNKELKDEHKFLGNLVSKLKKKKQNLLEQINRMYISGSWITRSPNMSFQFDKIINKSYLEKLQITQSTNIVPVPIQEIRSPPLEHAQYVRTSYNKSSTSLNTSILNEQPKRLMIEREPEVLRPVEMTPRNQNLWMAYQERQVSPMKDDVYRYVTEQDYGSPRSPSSPKKPGTPEKRPFLKRSAERYNPMKAVRESKEKSREISEESLNKSVNISVDSKTKVETRSMTPEKTKKEVKMMSKTVGKSLFRDEAKDRRDNRFFETRDASCLKTTIEKKIEKPKEKMNSNNMTDSQKVKSWKNVQSRVNCWITPKIAENGQTKSKTNLKANLNVTSNNSGVAKIHKTSKSPVRTAGPATIQKLKEQEEIKKKMSSSAAQLQKSKTFQTKAQEGKSSPSNALKNSKTMVTETDKSQVSFENTAESISAVAGEKKELRTLSEARIQRFQSKASGIAKAGAPHEKFVEKFREMERSLSTEKMNNAAYNILHKEIMKVQKKRSVEKCNLENYEQVRMRLKMGYNQMKNKT